MANTNPRKFVEKIALHTQRMAEEKAQVDKILREVAEVTRRSALSNLEEMNGGRSDTQIVYRDRGRTMTSGGPMRSRPGERRHDTSPYSSGPYLSPPPPDSNWRRTYSDSSLHQSAAAQTNESQRRAMDGQLTDGYEPSRRHLSVSPDGRPRSCEVPRVPGINIFPSAQEPGTVQIPIGNNTGSLPDLTSFQFSSPLPTPLDQEDHNSSPYSNSPQGTSPSTLSPTSRPQGRFSFGGNSPPNLPQTSPPNQESPSPPSPLLGHPVAGVTLDNSGGGGGKEQFSPQMVYQSTQRSPSPQHSMQPCSPLPIAQSSSPVPVVDYVNSLNSYRSPHPVNRPSPQNSPGLTVKYGSASPLSSSPQSPSPSSPSSTGPISFPEHNSYYITQDQANMLQHNFEQFSMRDSQGSLDYIGSTNNTSPYSQTDDPCPQELTQDPGYFSTSPSQQLQYSTRHSAQTTPNTPSSIPDIVLTDFSSTAEELANRNDEFTKELGVAMAGAFDTDEAFREGLGIIDFDALQMLTDPTEIITDPNAEEHFRQDRFQ
ncbi:CREB-regulated transcription coactivator 1-like isoform X1 [Macrosteles quadrilineatus]|uniref:CREB-regulated transcription coactivator 1-like isoform X1 n=1 Tax=Macrosteles quadrilineatus TaxID=74068 RepID=UPI0023E11677|nr:CREB-regulated transcription coactivator 1-like isoform X1 [Macrosteles quadrilineatus]